MLTSKKIAALKPREKRFVVTDGHGLTLRVHPTGSKTWCLRLSADGRVSDISLGRWPEVSLKQARQEARRRRKAAGLEPPRGYVFADAFRLWCNLKRDRIVSYRDERRMLENHLLPHVRNRQLDEITAPLVVHIVRPLDTSGRRVTLKRVLMRTREILDLAVCAGYIQHNPVERLSRIFAPPVTTPMAAVDWRELPSVMQVIKTAPRRMQVLFVWSLCSMLRPGESAKLRWSWIENNVLSIPAEEMKKGRTHRVPITPFMSRVLDAARDCSPHPRSGFVFPSERDGSKHISPQALAKFLHSTELRGRLVAHGLRSIARCWLADQGFPFEASEACISHVSGSGVSRAYQRSDYLDARTVIMEHWCSFVEDCARSAGVLSEIIDDFAEPNG
ncbi:MAG: integrase arm-type DNA-binding domain-containing protein [Sutterella parvirubra]|nr:integrase arm-type DNA-binding domain-containing protein [Sutterella parvirubra]